MWSEAWTSPLSFTLNLACLPPKQFGVLNWFYRYKANPIKLPIWAWYLFTGDPWGSSLGCPPLFFRLMSDSLSLLQGFYNSYERERFIFYVIPGMIKWMFFFHHNFFSILPLPISPKPNPHRGWWASLNADGFAMGGIFQTLNQTIHGLFIWWKVFRGGRGCPEKGLGEWVIAFCWQIQEWEQCRKRVPQMCCTWEDLVTSLENCMQRKSGSWLSLLARCLPFECDKGWQEVFTPESRIFFLLIKFLFFNKRLRKLIHRLHSKIKVSSSPRNHVQTAQHPVGHARPTGPRVTCTNESDVRRL